jgi:hypothetical protein
VIVESVKQPHFVKWLKEEKEKEEKHQEKEDYSCYEVIDLQQHVQ